MTGVRPGTDDLYVLQPEQGIARARIELRDPGLQVRNVTLDHGAVLRGRVADEAGHALQGAEVSFVYQARMVARGLPPFPPVASGSDGSFELPCMANVPTIVQARLAGDIEYSAEQRLTPSPGENPPLELILKPSAILGVDVVDSTGAPLPGLRVAAMTGRYIKDGRLLEGVTDSMGYVDLPLASVEIVTASPRFRCARSADRTA